jgi:hypothetical protein
VERAVVVAAVVADQVDLQEPGAGVVPVVPGLHGDRGLEHAAGAGHRLAFGGDQTGPIGTQPPVDGGRGHAQQLVDHLRGAGQFLMGQHGWYQCRQAWA